MNDVQEIGLIGKAHSEQGFASIPISICPPTNGNTGASKEKHCLRMFGKTSDPTKITCFLQCYVYLKQQRMIVLSAMFSSIDMPGQTCKSTAIHQPRVIKCSLNMLWQCTLALPGTRLAKTYQIATLPVPLREYKSLADDTVCLMPITAARLLSMWCCSGV
jgi:hypothetical protein